METIQLTCCPKHSVLQRSRLASCQRRTLIGSKRTTAGNTETPRAENRSALQAHLAQPSSPHKQSTLPPSLWQVSTQARAMILQRQFSRRPTRWELFSVLPGLKRSVRTPLPDAEASPKMTDKDSNLGRWSKHFQGLFSANRSVQAAAINLIPQLPEKIRLDDPSTLQETTETIRTLNSGKATGFDSISSPPPSQKYGSTEKLHSTPCSMNFLSATGRMVHAPKPP